MTASSIATIWTIFTAVWLRAWQKCRTQSGPLLSWVGRVTSDRKKILQSEEIGVRSALAGNRLAG
jgi:hypothetical protein